LFFVQLQFFYIAIFSVGIKIFLNEPPSRQERQGRKEREYYKLFRSDIYKKYPRYIEKFSYKQG
jgi:hypothetical protein